MNLVQIILLVTTIFNFYFQRVNGYFNAGTLINSDGRKSIYSRLSTSNNNFVKFVPLRSNIKVSDANKKYGSSPDGILVETTESDFQHNYLSYPNTIWPVNLQKPKTLNSLKNAHIMTIVNNPLVTNNAFKYKSQTLLNYLTNFKPAHSNTESVTNRTKKQVQNYNKDFNFQNYMPYVQFQNTNESFQQPLNQNSGVFSAQNFIQQPSQFQNPIQSNFAQQQFLTPTGQSQQYQNPTDFSSQQFFGQSQIQNPTNGQLQQFQNSNVFLQQYQRPFENAIANGTGSFQQPQNFASFRQFQNPSVLFQQDENPNGLRRPIQDNTVSQMSNISNSQFQNPNQFLGTLQNSNYFLRTQNNQNELNVPNQNLFGLQNFQSNSQIQGLNGENSQVRDFSDAYRTLYQLLEQNANRDIGSNTRPSQTFQQNPNRPQQGQTQSTNGLRGSVNQGQNAFKTFFPNSGTTNSGAAIFNNNPSQRLNEYLGAAPLGLDEYLQRQNAFNTAVPNSSDFFGGIQNFKTNQQQQQLPIQNVRPQTPTTIPIRNSRGCISITPTRSQAMRIGFKETMPPNFSEIFSFGVEINLDPSDQDPIRFDVPQRTEMTIHRPQLKPSRLPQSLLDLKTSPLKRNTVRSVVRSVQSPLTYAPPGGASNPDFQAALNEMKHQMQNQNPWLENPFETQVQILGQLFNKMMEIETKFGKEEPLPPQNDRDSNIKSKKNGDGSDVEIDAPSYVILSQRFRIPPPNNTERSVLDAYYNFGPPAIPMRFGDLEIFPDWWKSTRSNSETMKLNLLGRSVETICDTFRSLVKRYVKIVRQANSDVFNDAEENGIVQFPLRRSERTVSQAYGAPVTPQQMSFFEGPKDQPINFCASPDGRPFVPQSSVFGGVSRICGDASRGSFRNTRCIGPGRGPRRC